LKEFPGTGPSFKGKKLRRRAPAARRQVFLNEMHPQREMRSPLEVSLYHLPVTHLSFYAPDG
jgi:hypothetical protein